MHSVQQDLHIVELWNTEAYTKRPAISSSHLVFSCWPSLKLFFNRNVIKVLFILLNWLHKPISGNFYTSTGENKTLTYVLLLLFCYNRFWWKVQAENQPLRLFLSFNNLFVDVMKMIQNFVEIKYVWCQDFEIAAQSSYHIWHLHFPCISEDSWYLHQLVTPICDNTVTMNKFLMYKICT